MDKLTSMAVFACVVDTKSFSGAARQLGVSKSAVSKQISRLEEELGTTLIGRTTRSFHLTESGAAYYEYCGRILEEVAEAERAVARLHEGPKGTLRVKVPMSFGYLHVAPAIPDFLARFSDINVDIVLNDETVDLVESGFDLGIRVARVPDRQMVCEELASSRMVVCASPDYLARHGEPQALADLAGHNCLQFTLAIWGSDWPFVERGEVRTVPVTGSLEANNANVLRTAALDGLGIARLPTYIIGPDLRAGRLRKVLPQYRVPDNTIYAVYPQSRHLSPKIRAFIEFLRERFGPTPYWDVGPDTEPGWHGRLPRASVRPVSAAAAG